LENVISTQSLKRDYKEDIVVRIVQLEGSKPFREDFSTEAEE
jgi:hypothetical protein